jgi:hypothetical protein
MMSKSGSVARKLDGFWKPSADGRTAALGLSMRFFHVESTKRRILETNQFWEVWNFNAAGPEENSAVAIATSMKKLSRRQLLDGSIGIGAFLLTAGAVRAEDPMQSTMDMSSPMDMSPTMGMVSDKPAPAMDQPLVEPEVRRSVNGMLSTTLRVG